MILRLEVQGGQRQTRQDEERVERCVIMVSKL
jgi:hypothetical protein